MTKNALINFIKGLHSELAILVSNDDITLSESDIAFKEILNAKIKNDSIEV